MIEKDVDLFVSSSKRNTIEVCFLVLMFCSYLFWVVYRGKSAVLFNESLTEFSGKNLIHVLLRFQTILIG